jgi:hypothetical protein
MLKPVGPCEVFTQLRTSDVEMGELELAVDGAEGTVVMVAVLLKPEFPPRPIAKTR